MGIGRTSEPVYHFWNHDWNHLREDLPFCTKFMWTNTIFQLKFDDLKRELNCTQWLCCLLLTFAYCLCSIFDVIIFAMHRTNKLFLNLTWYISMVKILIAKKIVMDVQMIFDSFTNPIFIMQKLRWLNFILEDFLLNLSSFWQCIYFKFSVLIC